MNGLPVAAVLAGVVVSCSTPLPPKVAVTVENDLGAAKICDVFIRQSKHVAAGWGNDWLDREEVLSDGTLRTFQMDPGLTWDVRLVYCGGQDVGVLKNLTWDHATTIQASSLR